MGEEASGNQSARSASHGSPARRPDRRRTAPTTRHAERRQRRPGVGGADLAPGGVVCFDPFTSANVTANTASTSNNDVFGDFSICP